MALGTSAEIVRMYVARAESAPSLSRVHAQRRYDVLVARRPDAAVIEVDGSLAGQARLDPLNTADRRARLVIGLLHESDIGRGIKRKSALVDGA